MAKKSEKKTDTPDVPENPNEWVRDYPNNVRVQKRPAKGLMTRYGTEYRVLRGSFCVKTFVNEHEAVAYATRVSEGKE